MNDKKPKTQFFSDNHKLVDDLLKRFGPTLNLATPLGLGKPNQLLNEIYDRCKKDSHLQLNLFTALSLNPPTAPIGLGSRFLQPFADRHWGKDYPALQYAIDAEKNQLPKNVNIYEFYFRAGAALSSPALQRNYLSINYTHVAAQIIKRDIHAVLQLIAKNPKTGRYSLACNPDMTIDLVELSQKIGKPIAIIGVVHPHLPFLGGDAEVGGEFFDAILEDPSIKHEIFALPKLPITPIDHAIGFHASRLIKDDGTLQVGIGSLSDAVVHSLIMRHQKNDLYQQLTPTGHRLETEPFHKGLYGLSEMVTDGFMHLRRAGILKREVRDEKSGAKTFLHGAFFLGSKEFYQWLRDLTPEDYQGVRMTQVSKVNDLYDPNETLLREQRRNPRFLNTCMQVTILGAAASETLEDSRVVSGVGGQYNFVAMSHELKDSRSIIMLRSTREDRGIRKSNIIPTHGNATIPRHLRDIVVTEYGIADIRGKSDEETIQALLSISDSEFQDDLLEYAKKNGKISKNYKIPESARSNTPEKLMTWIKMGQNAGVFQAFPFGSDFTTEEETLALAIESLKVKTQGSKLKLVQYLLKSLNIDPKKFQNELKRVKLDQPRSIKARLERRLILKALQDLTF
jgi:acyl-CoA hydrolase